MKTLKEKLLNREVTIGSWITLGHTSVAEIMAKAGFDWLVVDMEHSVISLESMQPLLQVIEGNGLTPLVRVGENDSTLIKRVMDAGAHGVIVPMVNTKEQAEKAVKSVKYPAVGTRGVGLARAQGYGASFQEYARTVNENSIVIVQIEHIKAVNQLEGILEVDGVDGCIIGPYDLSGSLGVPGQFEHPDVVSAISKVESISKAIGKTLGFHVIPPDHQEVYKFLDRGYNFIAFSLDILFLGETCRNEVKILRDHKRIGRRQ